MNMLHVCNALMKTHLHLVKNFFFIILSQRRIKEDDYVLACAYGRRLYPQKEEIARFVHESLCPTAG